MTSTPARRIWSPPMPKIVALVRSLRAVARRAAYMSPLASPAERRICGAGIVGRGTQSFAGSGAGKDGSGADPVGGTCSSCSTCRRHVQLLLLVLQLVEAVVDAAQGE